MTTTVSRSTMMTRAMVRASAVTRATRTSSRPRRPRTVRARALDPVSAAHAVDPTILRCFNFLTLAPQVVPWGLMLVAPRWRVTRAIVEPWIVPLVCAAAHATVDGVGFASPGALEEAATFARVFDPSIGPDRWLSADVTGPFEAFNEMLENPNFVGEEWTHVLTWDLFVGRFVYLDALARGVPNLRASLLFINFTGPPGLLLYAATCVISGKGLPPIPSESGTMASSTTPKLIFVDQPTASASATSRLREAFVDGRGRAEAVIRACAPDVCFDDISAPSSIVGRDAVYAELARRDVDDDACGASIVVERVADGEKMAGMTFHRTNRAGERGLRGTIAVEVDANGMICRITRATEPILKPGGATAKLLKAVAKAPEGVQPKSRVDRAPSGAADIVKYLWLEVQGCDDFKEVALSNFSRDILYEDVNFELPFVGREQVSGFLDEFDIPGLTFNPLAISDGNDACVFTWEVDLNAGETATKVRGVSFYALDSEGKVSYIRDIPGSASSPVLGSFAAKMNPALRTFAPTPTEAELVQRAKART